jgi:hypothetical protein
LGGGSNRADAPLRCTMVNHGDTFFKEISSLIKIEAPPCAAMTRDSKVLVSTGFLEEQLRQVLLAFMLENRNTVELLDGANAPLGTFSARIAACSAFGLISDVETHDLTLIRRIRNDFAHDIHTTFRRRVPWSGAKSSKRARTITRARR